MALVIQLLIILLVAILGYFILQLILDALMPPAQLRKGVYAVGAIILFIWLLRVLGLVS